MRSTRPRTGRPSMGRNSRTRIGAALDRDPSRRDDRARKQSSSSTLPSLSEMRRHSSFDRRRLAPRPAGRARRAMPQLTRRRWRRSHPACCARSRPVTESAPGAARGERARLTSFEGRIGTIGTKQLNGLGSETEGLGGSSPDDSRSLRSQAVAARIQSLPPVLGGLVGQAGLDRRRMTSMPFSAA